MIITKKNQQRYERLEVDISKLKLYYVNRAKRLLKCLAPYNDSYADELKKVLTSFIKEPNKDLIDIIDEVKISEKGYNSFGINDVMFDIRYVDAELIKMVLNDEKPNLV